MHPARIAELLAPYLDPPDARRLTPDAFEHISTYIDLLQHWNTRINLTAIRDEDQIVTRHFGESLFAARHLFPDASYHAITDPASERRKSAAHGASRGSISFGEIAPEARKKTLADLGSGAGFPGIPIKLWAPDISLTLIESNHKKATFLKELARALTLTDINIQTARAETLPPATFDVVILRAVEQFESILPVAARLLADRGRLALLIGQAQLPTAQSGLSTLNWSAPLLLPGSESRVLTIASLKN